MTNPYLSGVLRQPRQLLFPILFFSCAAPETSPVQPEELIDHVAARAADASLARSAAELAAIPPLELNLPDVDVELDPTSSQFWRVCAYAWNPAVRQARQEVLMALARQQSAGAPDPVGVRVVDHEFGGDSALVESVATFDLLGILGVGESAAEQAQADVRVLRARCRLEQELWSARFVVERARVRLAAVRARQELLRVLGTELREDMERFRILQLNRRLSDAEWGLISAREDLLLQKLSLLASEEAALRHELAVAAGLPIDHPALDRPAIDALTDLGPTVELPSSARLLETHPRLRYLRLDVAEAEAQLRTIAASAIPGIRMGPHLSWPGSGTQLGGALQLTLPLPSQWRGEIEAALIERTARIQQLEDELLSHGSLARTAQLRCEEARVRQEEHAVAVQNAASESWRATRLRFRVGQATSRDWLRALDAQMLAVVLGVNSTATEHIATLDVLELAGPAVDTGDQS